MQNKQADDVRVICAESCGNAPKKAFLKEFNIAFAKGDASFIADSVSDDISWEIVGEKTIQGINQFTEWLENLNDHEVTEIHIKNILTHGRTGAVDGTLKMKDERSVHFCDVYHFTSAGKQAKIKSMTSYVIGLEQG